MRAVLLLSISVLAAGCLGADEPVEEAAVVNASGSVVTGANATALAADANDSVVVPVAVPISYSGSTPTGACVFMIGQCEMAQDGSEDYHALESSGRATRLAVSIAYEGQAPGMQFYVALCRGEGADESTVTCDDYQTAPSPIVLDVDLRADPAGTSYGISVGSVNDAAASAGAAMLFGPSTFTVEGVLTVIPG